MSSSAQRGFSLLELLIVLVVASGLILFGTTRYQQYKQERDLAVISQNVAQLFLALDQNYFENCKGELAINGQFQPSVSSEEYGKLRNTLLVENSADYRVSVENIGLVEAEGMPEKNIYQLVVRVNLAVDPKVIDWYQSSLQATDKEDSNTLVWRRLPGFISTQNQQNWINDGTLRYFKLRVEAIGEDEQTMACLF